MKKRICVECGKYPSEYAQTVCEFCMGISNKDDYIEQLQQENQQYKNAWGELKEYITKENITIQGVEVLEQEDLIDKMEELEQKHNLGGE